MSESKILNSVSSAMLVLCSIVVLSCLVGFSLSSWVALRYAFFALLVLHSIGPFRILGTVGTAGCIGITSWEWVLALNGAFASSSSSFHTSYLIVISIIFSLIFLVVFAYLFIFSLAWCLPKNIGILEDNLKLDSEEASDPSESIEPEVVTSFDPFQILEVDKSASEQEIHLAYRKQMQLYHPDRVNHLGPELQRTAHQQSLLIRRAFEELVSN